MLTQAGQLAGSSSSPDGGGGGWTQGLQNHLAGLVRLGPAMPVLDAGSGRSGRAGLSGSRDPNNDVVIVARDEAGRVQRSARASRAGSRASTVQVLHSRSLPMPCSYVQQAHISEYTQHVWTQGPSPAGLGTGRP